MAKNVYSYALVAFNRKNMGGAEDVYILLKNVGLRNVPGYRVTDLYENKYLGEFRPDDYLVVKVNPSGVVMVKAEAIAPAPRAVPAGHAASVSQGRGLPDGQLRRPVPIVKRASGDFGDNNVSIRAEGPQQDSFSHSDSRSREKSTGS